MPYSGLFDDDIWRATLTRTISSCLIVLLDIAETVTILHMQRRVVGGQAAGGGVSRTTAAATQFVNEYSRYVWWYCPGILINKIAVQVSWPLGILEPTRIILNEDVEKAEG